MFRDDIKITGDTLKYQDRVFPQYFLICVAAIFVMFSRRLERRRVSIQHARGVRAQDTRKFILELIYYPLHPVAFSELQINLCTLRKGRLYVNISSLSIRFLKCIQNTLNIARKYTCHLYKHRNDFCTYIATKSPGTGSAAGASASPKTYRSAKFDFDPSN